MIYFFKVCEGGCKCFGDGCDKVCNGISRACDTCCAPLTKVCDRPLGVFVFITAAVCLPASLCAVLAVGNEEIRACEGKLVVILCAANLSIGILNVCFTLYLQRRLVFGIQQEEAVHGSTAELTSKELLNRAGHIMIYDIGFCLYFFVYLGSFILNIMGKAWIAKCVVDTGLTTSLPDWSSSLMIGWSVVAVFFAFLWYFALTCDDACTPKKKPPQQHPASSGMPPAAPRRRRGFLMRLLFGSGVSSAGAGLKQARAPPVVAGHPVPPPYQAQPYQAHAYQAHAYQAHTHPVQQLGVPAPYQAQAHPGVAPVGGAPPYQAAQTIGAPHAPAYQGGMGQTHSSPTDSSAQGKASLAAKVAAGGLSAAGMGLQKAGKLLGGGRTKE
eukprot:TRINITY_DN1409_c0_g1_i1.p1 TRINITY_DN1409_c0_g1~~TRINITY_DN1409_c0_g1_i1.p1  ORF type:complete len:384 (-),score=54.62 TRINITY_DN1409_c0_g1_i1:221-1372(-)